MKRKLQISLLLAVLGPGLAMAAGPGREITDLATATGLHARQVQMVLGGRTQFPEYRTSYARVERQFIRALGEERYRALMAGREIVLDNGRHVSLAAR